MTVRRRDIAAAGVAAAALTAASIIPARAQSKTESTWDLIKRTGKVRMGIFDYPPYFLRDKASGEWVGAMVEMAKDIAKELDVKLETVEVGGFGEAVLSLQSGKVDMNFGLQATPKRATAIDFAGPIYWIEWVTVNNPKFHGKNWEDYNKPEVKVAVMQGTSDELLLRKIAPNATRVEFKEISQCILRSRRAAPTPSPPPCSPAWWPRSRTRGWVTSSIPSRALRCRAISACAWRTTSAGRS